MLGGPAFALGLTRHWRNIPGDKMTANRFLAITGHRHSHSNSGATTTAGKKLASFLPAVVVAPVLEWLWH